MRQLGNKIAKKRKDLGMTQTEFAEKLSVTRQTVSRWEAGSVLPDIDKVGDIAGILGVSCDYLLRDEIPEDGAAVEAAAETAAAAEAAGAGEAAAAGRGDASGAAGTAAASGSAVSRLIREAAGRKVRLAFYDEEGDYDLFDTDCVITDFEGSWIKVAAETKKGKVEKLIALSSVRSLEYTEVEG